MQRKYSSRRAQLICSSSAGMALRDDWQFDVVVRSRIRMAEERHASP
jgi:hypothetical protein